MFLSEVEVHVQNNVSSTAISARTGASMPAACFLDDHSNSVAIHR
jgi:hypothetical protein